jgi:hypothetical protein
MTPYEFTNKYLDGTIGMFDAVVIYNSIEQSGLGIYDDDLNPWGDIISIARAWCVTKDGGSLTDVYFAGSVSSINLSPVCCKVWVSYVPIISPSVKADHIVIIIINHTNSHFSLN